MKPQKYLCGVVMLMLFLAACETKKTKHTKAGPSGFSDDSFSIKVKAVLLPVDTAGVKKILPVPMAVRYTYQLDGYQPIWVKSNFKPTASASQLIDDLEDMTWDGIDPERYSLSAIKKLKEKLDTTKKNVVADALVFDTMLTHSYLAAARDLLLGLIIPKSVDSLWYHSNDSVWNAPQYLADSTGKYRSLNEFRSDLPTYTLLRDEYKRYRVLTDDTVLQQAVAGIKKIRRLDSEAIANVNTIIHTELPWVQPVPNDSVDDATQLMMAYQGYAGVRQTGKLDSNTLAHLAIPADTLAKKIRANMERIRWMQREFGNLYLIVDVPLMELFLRKDGLNAMHMRVVVGRQERQTPSLYANMQNLIINPSWGVPPTILKNDVLPGLEKSGKKYLRKKGLKAYDHEGNVVDPAFINLSNYRRYTYKQAPGNDNSLGYVKFNLPNHWDIYLHDTPHRDDFGKRDRFLSSGCVRVQKPKELAIYILSELEKKKYTMGKLDTMIRTHKTRWEILRNKIPVHIAYLTTFDDTTGKHIQFARDIYHRDNKLISLLN